MGRVSVKINTTKKLSDLNEYGVYHLSSLLLCCAAQFSEDHNPHHIAKLLLQVSQEGLETLSSSNCSVFLTVLKSCLAQCQLSVSLGLSLNRWELGDAISQAISWVVTKFEASQSDLAWKRLSQDVVKVYIESLTELTDVSQSLATGEESLVQSWVGRYLRCCSANEISSVVEAHRGMLTRARVTLCSLPAPALATLEQLQEINKIKEVISSLWRVVFPAVKDLCSSLTSPEAVATITANFLIQRAESLEWADSEASRPDLQELVKHFTQNRQIPDTIACSILQTLCHNSAVSSNVSRSTLLSSISLCSALALPGSSALESARAAWCQVTGDQEDQEDQDLDPARAIILDQKEDLDTISRLCSLCSDPTAWRGEGKVVRQYQVASWLVYHSNSLLYKSGQPSSNLLPRLLNHTLTPNDAFSPTWNLSLQQKKAIEQSLPTFLKGLLTLPDVQTDKFLLRKISEIIRIYLPRFDPQSHPLQGLLSHPPMLPDPILSGKVLEITISLLNRVILDNRIKSPSVSAACLRYNLTF